MKAIKIVVPPDKSISHRAIMLASISEGTTRIKNLLLGDDCLRTIEAFRAMGVKIDIERDVVVRGVGMRRLKKPGTPLYLGNSGTAMRILCGILAGQDFPVVLKGDSSLSKRPMTRIAKPLGKMGAKIEFFSPLSFSLPGRKREIYPPLKIHGGRLKAIRYKSKIASAQVKSCILLAGLFAKGLTSVSEPVKSRDHTERMLRQFGVKCKVKGSKCEVRGIERLKSPRTIEIPGDISSGAFFIVAGCILSGVKLIIKNIGLNPTRTGILDILRKMGADVSIVRRRPLRIGSFEPRGDIIVKSGKLKGVRISEKEVARAIDEIPILMVAACFAEGNTIIKGIGELRVKETDRIRSMVTNLRKIGAEIELLSREARRGKGEREYIVIKGGRPLHGGKVSSFGDHRTAMSMLIAGVAVKSRITVTGLDCINKSFPGFENLLCKKFRSARFPVREH